MKKRILSLILATLITLSMVGCASNNNLYEIDSLESTSTTPPLSNAAISATTFKPDDAISQAVEATSIEPAANVIEVVPCIYDYVDSFAGSIAVVQLNEKVGVINTTGKEIVPLGKYDSLNGFHYSEGMAIVASGKYPNYKYGFIDETGNEVVSPIYDNVDDFSDGIARVYLNNAGAGYINKTGKEIVQPGKYRSIGYFNDGMLVVELDGRFGYVDKAGNEIVPPKYYNVNGFSEGMTAVSYENNYTWGFIDESGNEIVSPKYERVENFSNGFALVYNGSYNYIDKIGNVVFGKYYYATSFSEGLAAVSIFDEEEGIIWNIIDTTGSVVASFSDYGRYYDAIGPFVEGMAWVLNIGTRGGYGFINTNGEEVIPHIYTEVENFFEGLANVNRGVYNQGVIDKTGKEIVPCNYSYIGDFSDGLTVAMLYSGPNASVRYSVFNTTGEEVIKDSSYSIINDFTNGYARVGSGSTSDVKYGIIDAECNVVVPPGKYDSVGDFFDGMASICVYNGPAGTYEHDKYKWGFVDETGSEIIPPKYDSVGNFFDGIAVIKLEGKWGFIDKTGNEVIPLTFEYEEVLDFYDGLAAVCLDGKWGFISVVRN